MNKKPKETTYHYETDYLKNDDLSELKEPLSRALDLSEEDFNRLSPEVKNLLSIFSTNFQILGRGQFPPLIL